MLRDVVLDALGIKVSARLGRCLREELVDRNLGHRHILNRDPYHEPARPVLLATRASGQRRHQSRPARIPGPAGAPGSHLLLCERALRLERWRGPSLAAGIAWGTRLG